MHELFCNNLTYCFRFLDSLYQEEGFVPETSQQDILSMVLKLFRKQLHLSLFPDLQ